MARRVGAVDIWAKRFMNSPAYKPPTNYVNWRGVEEANRPQPVIKAPVVRPAPVAPTRQLSGSDSLLASLAGEESAAMSRLKGAWGGFSADLSAALGALAAPIGGIYDRAEASGKATEDAIAARLGTSGQQASEGLGAKLAQINAPGTGAQDLGGIYKGAAGSGYAYGMSEVERLNAEGAAAELYANKLPAIGLLEGARIMNERARALQDSFTSRRQDLLYQSSRDQREDELRKQDLEIEERRRQEDRLYEQKKDRDARRAREKEFMLTLMADATAAQRKAAEARLKREWEKEDMQTKHLYDLEKQGVTQSSISQRQQASQAQANASREDQQRFQAEQNRLSREAAAKNKNKPKPESERAVGEWQVKSARDAVYRVNNKGEITWNPILKKKLLRAPNQMDGLINGAINVQLRSSGIDPFSPRGIAIRRSILSAVDGKVIGAGTYLAPKPKKKAKTVGGR